MGSDGTAGTVMVEYYARLGKRYPTSLTNVNGVLFFAASDGQWR